MLGRRDHSELELHKKLSKYYEPEDVAAALTRARDEKWLRPPNELAKAIGEYLHRRGKGALQIQMELKKRGLPEVEIDTDREAEKAKKLLYKIFPRLENSTEKLSYADKSKAYRRLSYRGFSADVISNILKDN
jgi:SOS response regulatory protein OraA/RecX